MNVEVPVFVGVPESCNTVPSPGKLLEMPLGSPPNVTAQLITGGVPPTVWIEPEYGTLITPFGSIGAPIVNGMELGGCCENSSACSERKIATRDIFQINRIFRSAFPKYGVRVPPEY